MGFTFLCGFCLATSPGLSAATNPPIAQQSYLKAPQVDLQDYFGGAVAVSGDTVVVGAAWEDSTTTGINSTPNDANGTFFNAGAAYVFVRAGTNWMPQAYLKGPQVDGNDRFGSAVAVSGDTVVVGAPWEDSATTGVNSTPEDSGGLLVNAGAAYVFVRSATNWTQQAYLKAHQFNPNRTVPGQFGTSVAVSDDTVVVTGVDSTTNATAYVFVRTGTNWAQQALLKIHPVTTNDIFDLSVAISGDTVVVGSSSENSSTTGINGEPNEGAPNAGAAYVFVRSGTNWTRQAFLKAHQVSRDDRFGNAVAVSGDTAVVGAFWEDSGATGVNSLADEAASSSGAAYVFVRTGTNWAQQAYLKAHQVSGRDFFGVSVGVSGDTVVVGAESEASSSSGIDSTPNESAGLAGAAYVFVRAGTNWTQQAYLKAHQVTAVDYFGRAVGVSGDTVVVGATHEDSNATGVNGTANEAGVFGSLDAGAAYVFTGFVAPPAISRITGLHPFRFQFEGGSRTAFEIEASTNLIHWVPVGEAASVGGGLFQFSDVGGTNFPSRFYRVKAR